MHLLYINPPSLSSCRHSPIGGSSPGPPGGQSSAGGREPPPPPPDLGADRSTTTIISPLFISMQSAQTLIGTVREVSPTGNLDAVAV